VIAHRSASHEPIRHPLGRVEGRDLFLDRHPGLTNHPDRAKTVGRGMTLLSQDDFLDARPIHPALVVGIACEDRGGRRGNVLGQLDLHGRPS
jgi:hypothetical protein